MSYFIHDGSRQIGPFTVEELKGKGILKTTPVWTEGLSDWVQASTLAELQSVVLQTPPAFTGTHLSSLKFPNPSATERIGYYIGRYLWRTVIFSLVVVAGMLLYFRLHRPTFQVSASSPFSFVDPEHDYPAQYLVANGTYRPNFWRTKEEITGTVSNRATHTNYKDVRIKVIFYSQTNSVISSQEYILYQYVPYGSTNSFSLEVDKPAAAATCGWTAVGATYY